MTAALAILAAVLLWGRRGAARRIDLPGPTQDTDPVGIDEFYDRKIWGGIYAARPGGGRGGPIVPGGGGGGGRGQATGQGGRGAAGVSG